MKWFALFGIVIASLGQAASMERAAPCTLVSALDEDTLSNDEIEVVKDYWKFATREFGADSRLYFSDSMKRVLVSGETDAKKVVASFFHQSGNKKFNTFLTPDGYFEGTMADFSARYKKNEKFWNQHIALLGSLGNQVRYLSGSAKGDFRSFQKRLQSFEVADLAWASFRIKNGQKDPVGGNRRFDSREVFDTLTSLNGFHWVVRTVLIRALDLAQWDPKKIPTSVVTDRRLGDRSLALIEYLFRDLAPELFEASQTLDDKVASLSRLMDISINDFTRAREAWLALNPDHVNSLIDSSLMTRAMIRHIFGVAVGPEDTGTDSFPELAPMREFLRQVPRKKTRPPVEGTAPSRIAFEWPLAQPNPLPKGFVPTIPAGKIRSVLDFEVSTDQLTLELNRRRQILIRSLPFASLSKLIQKTGEAPGRHCDTCTALLPTLREKEEWLEDLGVDLKAMHSETMAIQRLRLDLSIQEERMLISLTQQLSQLEIKVRNASIALAVAIASLKGGAVNPSALLEKSTRLVLQRAQSALEALRIP